MPDTQVVLTASSTPIGSSPQPGYAPCEVTEPTLGGLRVLLKVWSEYVAQTLVLGTENTAVLSSCS